MMTRWYADPPGRSGVQAARGALRRRARATLRPGLLPARNAATRLARRKPTVSPPGVHDWHPQAFEMPNVAGRERCPARLGDGGDLRVADAHRPPCRAAGQAQSLQLAGRSAQNQNHHLTVEWRRFLTSIHTAQARQEEARSEALIKDPRVEKLLGHLGSQCAAAVNAAHWFILIYSAGLIMDHQ